MTEQLEMLGDDSGAHLARTPCSITQTSDMGNIPQKIKEVELEPTTE